MAHILQTLWQMTRITAQAMCASLGSVWRRDALARAIAHGEHDAARRHLSPTEEEANDDERAVLTPTEEATTTTSAPR